MDYNFSECTLCPRECRADRINGRGLCGEGHMLRAAKAQLHMWEEPCLSGTKGAGAVFFSGCSLKCCFCQNRAISSEDHGREITEKRLGEIFLNLQDKGAHCIDLVSPTHFVPQIINALDGVKSRLKIPVVYNCGGYEKKDTVKMLDGYIDVYLPDFKYMDSGASKKYSGAENYFENISQALPEMRRQTGKCAFDENGIIQRGVIVRHLVLPGLRHDSVNILEWLSENLDGFILSLMSQYTPQNSGFKEIERRVSTFEYKYVLEKAEELGLEGYMQERTASDVRYIPDFDLSGL